MILEITRNPFMQHTTKTSYRKQVVTPRTQFTNECHEKERSMLLCSSFICDELCDMLGSGVATNISLIIATTSDTLCVSESLANQTERY